MQLWLIQVIQDDLSIPHYHIYSYIIRIRYYKIILYCIILYRIASCGKSSGGTLAKESWILQVIQEPAREGEPK